MINYRAKKFNMNNVVFTGWVNVDSVAAHAIGATNEVDVVACVMKRGEFKKKFSAG